MKIPQGRVDIGGDLGFEGIDVGKGSFSPDPVVKEDFVIDSVKVAGETRKVCLDHRTVGSKGGLCSDIGG